MPRVAKSTLKRSWIVGIVLSTVTMIFTFLFLYIPFLRIVQNPSECSNVVEDINLAQPDRGLTSCIELTVLDIGVLKIGNIEFRIGNIPIFDILDLTLLSVLLVLVFPAYYYRKDHAWRTKADRYLPFLLREISDAQKVGLPLPRAVIAAAKRQYGPLSEELERMAAKISWGIPFSTGLRSMQKNINTPLFDRTAVLILEAEKSGGETADIFDSAYLHVTELLGLQRERLSAMSPYRWIIIVAFLVFSVVIIILLNTFFAQLAVQSAQTAAAGQATLGGLTLPLAVLQVLFFHMLLIEGFFAGLIAAKMSNGNIKVGLLNSIILLLIGWVFSKLGALTI